MMTAAMEAVIEAAADLECGLVGAMVANEAIAITAADILQPDHFGHPMTRIAFEKAKALIEHDGRITLQVLFNQCALAGGPDRAELSRWIASTSIVPMNVMGVIDEIIDNWARRSLIDAGVDAQHAAAAGNPPHDVARILMDQCDAINASKSRRITAPASLETVSRQALVSASQAYEHGGQRVMISWGLVDLDRRTNGLRRKELVLIGGRPSMGKTVLATSVLRQAGHAGHGCALFSLEMDAEAISTRMLSDEAYGHPNPVAYADIMSGKFSTTQWSSLTDAQQRMARLPVVIDEQRGLGIAEIASRARRIRNQFEAAGRRLDIVAVDYLGLVRASTTYRGQRVNEIAEISAGLKAMAQELDCCVICLQQLSRQLEQRDNKRPVLSDLRDSGALEQDADLVAFVYRDEYYAAREQPATDSQRLELEDRLERSHNVMEFIIAKQRNGPVGTVRLHCDVAHAAVREIVR